MLLGQRARPVDRSRHRRGPRRGESSATRAAKTETRGGEEKPAADERITRKPGDVLVERGDDGFVGKKNGDGLRCGRKVSRR
jgi:hypothetical protein